jgi:hypothetical protein
MLGLAVSDINYEKYFYGHSPATTTTLFEYIKPGPIVCNLLKIIVYYVMRSTNEVLCAAAGRLAAERSEADKPAKANKTIFAPNNIYNFFFKPS